MLLGNHDVSDDSVLALEVDEVAACLEIDFQGRLIFVSHYPMNESLLEPGELNIDGHLHNTPLPASLGSGSRHINMCVDARTREYVARRTGEGHSKKEIHRCLKRYIVRELYRQRSGSGH